MALTLPKLALPKLALTKKQIPVVVGGVVVLAAAAWFGMDYLAEEAPPPPIKPQPVTAVKPAAKALTPAEIEKARDTLIEDVLAASGLDQLLEQLPERLAAGVRQSGKPPRKTSPEMVKAVEDAMAGAFTADGFKSRARADLKKNFDQRRLQSLLKDFSTPAAKSMIALERAPATPEELAKFASAAAATKSPPERTALIERIDAATRASDLAVESAFASMNALAGGMAGGDARRAAAIDKTIEKQRAAATQNIRDATLLNLSFSFRDASDADLEKYAGIYEAENSKWLYGQVYAALLEEIKAASTVAGEQIGKLSTKIAAAPAQTRSKSRADARACLGLASNTAIIKCAEAYR